MKGIILIQRQKRVHTKTKADVQDTLGDGGNDQYD